RAAAAGEGTGSKFSQERILAAQRGRLPMHGIHLIAIGKSLPVLETGMVNVEFRMAARAKETTRCEDPAGWRRSGTGE
ncbi:MAG TPA: hypothetical protein VLK84_13705, partial [Longimicrobium sp.]|nr:hypothetical protein [Longimicrobium sp.]